MRASEAGRTIVSELARWRVAYVPPTGKEEKKDPRRFAKPIAVSS